MTDSVALLLQRAGFGPTAPVLAAARRAGFDATLAALTSAPRPAAPVEPDLGLDPYADMPDPTPDQRASADGIRRAQTDVIMRWWLDRLTTTTTIDEKLVLFWHGHWATSVEKVMSPQLMLRQQNVFRSTFDFTELCRRMVVDPALVYSLDGHLNTATAPNENLGRELMELFMLGIGHYTERDVKEAGRALTGWWVNLGAEECDFDPARHDGGEKTVLGAMGEYGARDLVEHLLRQPSCPRFLAARLWFRYGSAIDALPPSTEKKMVAAFPHTLLMLRAMFADEPFHATAGRMVKQPVEWLVGALRQLGLRVATLPDADYRELVGGLRDLGQLPFSPPSVGGWPSGGAWLTPSSARLRLTLSAKLAELARVGPMSADALATTLAVDTWSDRTFAALNEVSDGRLRMAVALSSPEYLVT